MKRESRAEQRGRIKIRVIELDLEGGDGTLEEGIRAVTTALKGAPTPAQRTLDLRPPKSLEARPQGFPDGIEPQRDDEEEQNQEAQEDHFQPTQAKATSEPKPFRPPPRGKILEGLKFDGPPALDEYLKTHKVPQEEDGRAYLAITQWFRDVAHVNEVTKDHIHTAYKYLTRAGPNDVGQPFRDGKRRGWYVKGSKPGSFVLHNIGEKVIIEMAQAKTS